MQDADKDAWNDDAGFGDIPLYYTTTKDINAWAERNATKKSKLELLWRGAACTCGAGVSHVMCVVVPAMAGGVSGGVGGLLSSAWAMYAISPVLAVAANAGIDRLRKVERDTWSKIRGAAVTSVIAIGLTGAINYATGHEHFDPAKLGELNSLSGVERIEWLADYRHIHESMDPDLKRDVELAAQEKGLSPAEYISICSGLDPLGERIAEASRSYWQQKSEEFQGSTTLSGAVDDFAQALYKEELLQYNITEPR